MLARRGRLVAEIVLSDEEREALQRWARFPKSSQALALRCGIVLAAESGVSNQQIAKDVGCNPVTVGKRRTRFAVKRLDGLIDEPRPGQPRKIADEMVEQVITTTLESTPDDGSTHWSTRSMAAKVGLNQTGRLFVESAWRRVRVRRASRWSRRACWSASGSSAMWASRRRGRCWECGGVVGRCRRRRGGRG